MRKIILTDIDGVVLDWQSHFNDYLDKYYPGQELFDPTVFAQGEETGKIIKEFNNTAWIGFLKPRKDSVEVLTEFKNAWLENIWMHIHGHRQICKCIKKKEHRKFNAQMFLQS